MTQAENCSNTCSERHDVQPKEISQLDWSSVNRREAIHTVFLRAEKHATEAIRWYLLSKQGKKRCAQSLRLGVISLTALAGLIPILGELHVFPFSTAWASAALGFAALLLAIDKFFGCSTAWMRFIAAEHEIRQCLHEFQMDYEIELASWDGAEPDVEQTQKILNRCKVFLYQVDGIIRQETDKWLAEFQDAIKQIDSAAAAKPEKSETGGINVTLTNADQFPQGWKITVDDGNAIDCSGQSAALAGLSAGIHKLRLDAQQDQQTKTVERLVTVTGGLVTEQSFEL